MKNRILIFIIGILTGAILATSGWIMYQKAISQKQEEQRGILREEDRKEPPQMPMGERPQDIPNHNE